MQAAQHPRQTERLAALRSFDILDTPREKDFDDIAALASEICETPIAVVNLIDEDRQWFKAETGLGVRETPLESSICAHAILDEDFVEIPDTLADGRLCDNPLCLTEPGLRFYAGAQLRTAAGLPIGTLCVLDTQPRSLTPLQRQTLQVLARQVMTQIELRAALRHQVLLRQEVDHRVKNSLHSVAALVRMERKRARDTGADALLGAIETRIETISLIHRELYETRQDGRIDLGHYLPRLVELLQRTAPASVTLSAEADAIVVGSERASTIGMIVSEFVTNSLKHAFPDGRSGTVRIVLSADGPGMARLSCRDDGIGPQGEPARGIGLRIIAAGLAQLGAVALPPEPGRGMALRLEIPLG